MKQRAVCALLWFAVVWFGYEIIWSVAGVPRLIGPVLAAALATIVTFDPTGQVWPTRELGQDSRRPVAGPGLDPRGSPRA